MTGKVSWPCFLGSQYVYTVHPRTSCGLLPAQRCHWLAPTSDMGRVGRSGGRVPIWACSHVLRHRQVHLNALNPGLEETLALEENRNEVKEQLVIMLLPVPLCRPSAVGQWRGAYSHNTNHRFRIISIAKIGGSKLLASRAPENEAVRDRRPHGGARRIRGLALFLGA